MPRPPNPSASRRCYAIRQEGRPSRKRPPHHLAS